MNESDVQYRKKCHPQEKGNFLSNLLFCWTYPVFINGLKKDITEQDLFPPMKIHESSLLGDKIEKTWNDELKISQNPSLLRALWKVFGKEIIMQGVAIFFVEFGVKLIQPFCLGKLMTYYEPNQTTVSKNEAYLNAFLIVAASFLNVLIGHSIVLKNMHLGMRMKVACCSLVYRKALKLSKSALASATTGQMINILSNDVRRFDHLMMHFHTFWSAPIQIIVIACLLYVSVDPMALSGLALLVTFVILQMYLGKLAGKYRSRIAIKTDNRVRLMNEIIGGIQVIKMYTWEKPFAKLVEFARKIEVKQLQYAYNLRAVHASFIIFVNRASIFVCILSYVLSQNHLDAYYVFVVTSFYNILQRSLIKQLPKAVLSISETRVSANRIETFLRQDEISKNRFNPIAEDTESNNIGVKISNGSAKWTAHHQTDYTLSNIDLKISAGELVAIIGPVGSGKSSVLHAILKELPLIDGYVEVNGKISYASQEPWLFSASIRQNILFGQMWNETKYEKVIRVCSLETDLSLFPYGDQTIVGEKGVLLSGGQKARINLARTVYKDADIYLLDDPMSAVDAHVGKQLFDNCISGYLKNKCVVLVTHQLQYLQNAVNRIFVMHNGKFHSSGSYDEIKQSEDNFVQLLHKQNESKDNQTEEIKNKNVANGMNQHEDKNNDKPKEIKEYQKHGDISRKVYSDYFKAGGKLYFYIVFLLFVCMQIGASFSDYFISFWVNLEQSNFENYRKTNTTVESFFTTKNCIIIYSILMSLVVILTLAAANSFMKVCMRASKNLHNNMFNNIVYTTIRFFNMNPSGRILNRFSKDMGLIDEGLPETMLDTIQNGLQVLAISILVVTVNPWILIPTVTIGVIFYLLRTIFLATSRNVKRLEGITKSPVFSHLATTLHGLTTIRAFAAEEVLKNEFDAHQNLNSSAFYLFLAINRAFGFILDFHCTIYIGLVTTSFLFLSKETYGGTVGLAITQSIVLIGMVQFGMRQWSDLVNQMTSVERIVEYTELEKEITLDKKPPENWPSNGNISFKGVSLRYAPTDCLVLKNLNFSIKSGEKIGIVGRTGAGKSSIIFALFHLTQIENGGTIEIDGIDTKTISLESLRSNISIIPQEPILFSGTLRRNLDPFDKYKDLELWSALEEVELKSVVTELAGGLDTKLSEGGSNFSVGQRQLVCLARAILRNNKILVLDEATANVDPQTDSLIQTTIRKKFEKCTVLTIAHRLHTIMDSDKILVMDAGEAVEYDHPHLLLENSKGVFYSLVKQSGIILPATEH